MVSRYFYKDSKCNNTPTVVQCTIRMLNNSTNTEANSILQSTVKEKEENKLYTVILYTVYKNYLFRTIRTWIEEYKILMGRSPHF